MASVDYKTDIHLVGDLETAFEVALDLEAQAVGLDMEGVLGNYVGNQPYETCFDDFMRGQGKVNMSRARDFILGHSDISLGIITNNINESEGQQDGLVTQIANHLEIPMLHKGMLIGGVALRSKPSGDQSEHFCEMVGVKPEHTVLIDDQGVKNTGEAVRSRLKAIIVPDPIGLPGEGHRAVKEHKWVRRVRVLEPRIYSSLQAQGWLARVAYSKLAKIDLSLIGSLHDHRVT